LPAGHLGYRRTSGVFKRPCSGDSQDLLWVYPMEQTILWYDLETFGTNPFHDRIAQFAAIRTNFAFEPVGDPVVLYARPADDYVPDPGACLVTGITPATCAEKGMSEYELALRMFKEMMVPGTTVAGYNSVQFDDEFVRNLFYRNLLDPYLREYAQGNSRWDLINLVRATRDLRPEGISWPEDDTGRPQFKLELLAAANGIGHEQAHDALSDVKATIGLARLIKERQPRLFAWAFKTRKKDELRKLFDLNVRPALVHSAAYLTRDEGTSTLICPVGVPGEQARQGRDTLICADLRFDPEEIMGLSVDEIRDRVFLPAARQDTVHKRFPLYSIKINRCPFIAPLNTLSDERARALEIDIDSCLKHRETLLANRDLSARIRQVFNEPPHSSLPSDPDYQIYTGGFFSDRDRETFAFVRESLEEILAADPGQRTSLMRSFLAVRETIAFEDAERIGKLISRILGRSFPEYLPPRAAQSWREFCQNRILFPLLDEAYDLQKAKKEIGQKMKDPASGVREKIILKELSDYIDELKRRTLEV
jgi:exodeoxyribonuclease-1